MFQRLVAQLVLAIQKNFLSNGGFEGFSAPYPV